MANTMCTSEAALFYSNFHNEELQLYASQACPDISANDPNMFINMLPTPSPSGSSVSGYSEEGDLTGIYRGPPMLRIVEQPVPKFRFRYRSEMQGAHGSLLGQGESTKKKTFPTVELVNYEGEEVIIRCLLYTARDRPIPHMHQLIAKDNNKEILDHEIIVSERNGFRAEFKGLGIVHMSKKDLKKELVRKKEKAFLELLRSDPALAHVPNETLRDTLKIKIPALEKEAAKEAESMDPNKVKLCFQAFCRGPRGEVNYVCNDVFSNTIENLKSAETGELKISRMDRCAGSCNGGDEIYILVEKVSKKNIKVRFFELDEHDQEVWSDYGQFSELDVHHQYAIVLRTPPYRDTEIGANVKVKVELIRPKDKARSEPLGFTYKPSRRCGKRPHTTYSSSESFSSSEVPKKLKQQGLSSYDDPMLSGSDSSRLSSWNFPSDVVQEAISNLSSDDDPIELLSEFANFINSPAFPDYSQSLSGNHPLQDQNSSDISYPNLQSQTPLETFGDLSINVDWTIDSSGPSNPIKSKQGENHESVVTDSSVKKDATKKEGSASKEHSAPHSGRPVLPAPNLGHAKTKVPLQREHITVEQVKDDSLGKARRAYLKLLKLMKSRHPSRLQDMKNIIRAEDQEYGPLHAAVLHGQLKELSDLLSLIIKSNQLKLINTVNSREQTPLMVAVEENSVDCLKLLCMAKADLNLVDNKENTAFHIAAENKQSQCLKVLLAAHGMKDAHIKTLLDSNNDEGETALHIAVRHKDFACVKLLLSAGADLNAKTGTAGQTPLHIAVQLNCNDIVKLFLTQENLNLDEVNFNKKKAEDLINANQKEIMALFKKSPGGEIERLPRKEKEEDNEEEEEEEEDEDEDDEDEDEDEDDEDEDDNENVNENEEEKAHYKKDEEMDEEGAEKPTQTPVDVSQHQESEELDSDEFEDCEENETSDRKCEDAEQDEFGSLDPVTLNIVVESLDKNQNWKTVCQKLNCNFLIGTFSHVTSPSRCLITYLEFEKKKVTLSEFRSILDQLNIPSAVRALDAVLAKRNLKQKLANIE